jgi:hypothetical protein
MILCLVLTVLHHIAFHLMHCTMLCLAHLYSYTLNCEEPELEEIPVQVQAEDLTNTNPVQGKPGCI